MNAAPQKDPTSQGLFLHDGVEEKKHHALAENAPNPYKAQAGYRSSRVRAAATCWTTETIPQVAGWWVVGGCKAWLAPEFLGLEMVDDVEIASFWVDFFPNPSYENTAIHTLFVNKNTFVFPQQQTL